MNSIIESKLSIVNIFKSIQNHFKKKEKIIISTKRNLNFQKRSEIFIKIEIFIKELKFT